MGAEWEEIFARVPRAEFLPDLMWPFDERSGGYSVVNRAEDPVEWERQAGRNAAMVTQWDDGRHEGREPGEVPTSSGSKPSLVVRMLQELDVRPGHRVLDVGVGTGWTTALLSARVGAANVVGVEIDPEVAEAARGRLRRAGFGTPVVTGDGGWAAGAPYDRVQVTFAVRRVPGAWVEQTRVGGVLLVPWDTGFTDVQALVRLTVEEDGLARGAFVGTVGFMMSRPQRGGVPVHREYFPSDVEWPDDTVESVTEVRHDELLDDPYGTAAFVVGLRVPEVVHSATAEGEGMRVVYFYSLRCRSWAVVFFQEEGRQRVLQGGKRRVWDEVEGAFRWWMERGRPEVGRFGLTVRVDGGREVWFRGCGG
ncbi:methyltransferase domain-containing protein [Sinosporangium siamense]|uniref:methyltransferase domain-containing protein n=1 Tax=Sinosporangium siamense TaxID=1367973 RepID=UPI00194DC9D3|nr:methyltransferase domain-containing protein [Sinosporangium siamense]